MNKFCLFKTDRKGLDLLDDMAIQAQAMARNTSNDIHIVRGHPEFLNIISLAKAIPSLTVIASSVSGSNIPPGQ